MAGLVEQHGDQVETFELTRCGDSRDEAPLARDGSARIAAELAKPPIPWAAVCFEYFIGYLRSNDFREPSEPAQRLMAIVVASREVTMVALAAAALTLVLTDVQAIPLDRPTLEGAVSAALADSGLELRWDTTTPGAERRFSGGEARVNASRSTRWPVWLARLVARWRNSVGKLPRSTLRLTPMPSTRWATRVASAPSSIRMPAVLSPPSSTSLGHLISMLSGSGMLSAIAPATATADARIQVGASAVVMRGRSTSEV